MTNMLRVVGMTICIPIMRILLKVASHCRRQTYGGKKITINWQDEEAVKIPIRRR